MGLEKYELEATCSMKAIVGLQLAFKTVGTKSFKHKSYWRSKDIIHCI